MTDQLSTPDAQSTATAPQFDQYVSYEDSGGTVVCDRSNAAAWIRSSVVWPCER